MDTQVFTPDVQPKMKTARYPQLTPSFESANVPGLYIAGTLMHGQDWKKSSGGFIHGFRYLVRTLHRQLEVDHHGQPWPASTTVPLEFRKLTEKVFERVNSMSGA